MKRSELNTIIAHIRLMNAKAAQRDRVRAAVEHLRDEAVLPSTKAIYQAILDLFDKEE